MPRNTIELRRFQEYVATAEMQLLLACCRRAAGRLDVSGLSEVLARPFNEQAFLVLCRQHRLVVLVYKMLVRPFPGRLSSEMVSIFEREAQKHTLIHVRLSKSLVDLHRELELRHIRHLFLKGPVLNQQLFGGELLRYSRDLDVLIDPDDIQETKECLEDLGFHSKGFRVPFFRVLRKDAEYKKNGAGYTIELHWRTDRVETILGREFDWEKHVTHCDFQNELIPVFSHPYNCLYLCLHAAKHHWRRFRWLLDIPVFIQRTGVDPVRLLDLACRHGLQSSVREAFFISEHVLKMDYGLDSETLPDQVGEQAARQFNLVNKIHRSGLQTLVLTYYKSLLYPKIKDKLGFWLAWTFETVSDQLEKMSTSAPVRIAKSPE